MNVNDVFDAFEVLENWEARYEMIGDLEKELLPLQPGDERDEHLVRGCNTKTWLTGNLSADQRPVIEYRAQAETPLVRGLVALLLVPFQRQTPEAVLATDAQAYINKLGLAEHLSPNRRAGMEHFIARVFQIARELKG